MDCVLFMTNIFVFILFNYNQLCSFDEKTVICSKENSLDTNSMYMLTTLFDKYSKQALTELHRYRGVMFSPTC